MEAAEAPRSDGTGPEGPQGPAGRSELSPGAPGEPPGPEVLHGPGEPEEPRPEEPPGPEEPKACEPDQPGLEEPDQPGLEEVESRDPEPPGPEELGLQKPGPEEPEQPGPEEPEQPGLEEVETREPEPPGPEEPGLEEPGPGEPEQPGLEEPEETGLEEVEPCEPEQPGPEEPGLEAAKPCEREEPGLEEVEPPVPAGPSEPEVAAGASEPERSDREESPDAGPSVAAPAAGGAGEEEEEAVSGRAGAAGEEREAAEENEEERRERAALLEELGRLAAERERLRQTSARQQLRLAELLRLRQGERRPRAQPESDGPEPYGRRLQQLQELREQREREVVASRERVAARRRAGEERQARARSEWAAFQARKKEVAVSSLGRRLGGREAAAAAVVRIQAREEEKEQQVHEARVENIKLKHEIQTLETILKAKGELVESQHVMRFELTKRENQKHSEKIDDLCDEILKLKKKVSTTACILSEFREKVQFVEAENRGRKAELMEIETILSQKRDVLTKTKQARDRLWRSNLKLQQKCGLLGNEILLRDYEEKVDTIELLSQQLETLKHHHAGLILTCRGIQEKIKEASFSFLAEDNLRKESMKKK